MTESCQRKAQQNSKAISSLRRAPVFMARSLRRISSRTEHSHLFPSLHNIIRHRLRNPPPLRYTINHTSEKFTKAHSCLIPPSRSWFVVSSSHFQSKIYCKNIRRAQIATTFTPAKSYFRNIPVRSSLSPPASLYS